MTPLHAHQNERFPDDDALLALIRDRVEDGRATGIVLGVLDADRTRRIVAYGDPGPGAPPLGPDSVFEIGSITKAFTGILLADMAARGEVDLTAPVQRYAPAGLHMPTRGGREIALVDLACHRSGLPRLPGNLKRDSLTNPYAEYSVAQMYEFLAGYELPLDIGTRYEYSNLGMGLLGHVLAARAGVNYETLVRHRILEPLGMTMSGVALSPAMKAQLAIGHNAEGQPTGLWDIPTLAGAGALRSTMKDMLTFLDANIGEPRNDLERAMRVSHSPLAGGYGMECGLGWHILSSGQDKILFHDGGTEGYRSAIGFDPALRVGAAILTNSGKDASDVVLHLIHQACFMSRPIARTAIDVPAEVLARYVGEYRFLQQPARPVALRVTLEDRVLMMQANEQAKAPIYAESETKFFALTADTQFTFLTDTAGVATALILHQPRFSRTVKKVR